jgi:hypothetical protein
MGVCIGLDLSYLHCPPAIIARSSNIKKRGRSTGIAHIQTDTLMRLMATEASSRHSVANWSNQSPSALHTHVAGVSSAHTAAHRALCPRCAHAVRKVGCFPPLPATGPRVLNSAPPMLVLMDHASFCRGVVFRGVPGIHNVRSGTVPALCPHCAKTPPDPRCWGLQQPHYGFPRVLPMRQHVSMRVSA